MLGWLLGVGILVTLGIIAIGIGLILAVLGTVDRPIGPRRYCW